MASEGCAVVYMPILKGREGELKAIDHLPEALAAKVMPVFEVPPTSGDPIKDAHSFAEKARDVIPRGMAAAVDARYLDDPDGAWRGPLQAIADDFADWCVPIRPVLHLNDSERRLVEAGQAAEMHDGRLSSGSAVTSPILMKMKPKRRWPSSAGERGRLSRSQHLFLTSSTFAPNVTSAESKRWHGSAWCGRGAIRGNPSRWLQGQCRNRSVTFRTTSRPPYPDATWLSGGASKNPTSSSGTTASPIPR